MLRCEIISLLTALALPALREAGAG